MYYSILVMSVTVHVDLRGKLQVCLFILNIECCYLVYWEGEDAVTVLTSDKVSFDKKEVGFPCSVREGRITHSHGKLAAFGTCTVTTFVHVHVHKRELSYTNVCVHCSYSHTTAGTKAELNQLMMRYEEGDWRPPFCSDGMRVAVETENCAPSVSATSREDDSVKGNFIFTTRGRLPCTSLLRVSHWLATLLGSTRESILALRCNFWCLQGTQSWSR